jgi:hypothetical protein
MSSPTRSIYAVAADGRRFRLRFDGSQDFSPLPVGRQEQYTALEEIPGLAPLHGTIYACSVAARGYRIEATEHQPKELQ